MYAVVTHNARDVAIPGWYNVADGDSGYYCPVSTDQSKNNANLQPRQSGPARQTALLLHIK